MSLKQRAHGSELYGYPIPRRPITFDPRQEPGAGKPHAGICAGGEEQSSSRRRQFEFRTALAVGTLAVSGTTGRRMGGKYGTLPGSFSGITSLQHCKSVG